MKNHVNVREKLGRYKGNVIISPWITTEVWCDARANTLHEVGGSRGLLFPAIEVRLSAQLNRTLNFLQPRIGGI